MKMIDLDKYIVDARYSPKQECRWKTYSSYKLLLIIWMLNELSVVVTVTEISHNGYYIHLVLHSLSVILIGIPLVYSEICLAQYTKAGVISMWNFFPIFRPVGYGAIYLIILKTLYVMVLTSWYLQYTFYASLDPPPWFSCDDFNATKCMVKRVNISVFQHCLEAQLLFDDDCGVKTASNCFFEKEIGDNNFMTSVLCFLSWKSIIASAAINTSLFLLSLAKTKFLQIAAKLLVIYVSIVLLALLSVSLSTSGAWYATKITIDWSKYNIDNCFKSITWGFLSVGTGCGVIGFLTKDVPFRSPATMTSISTSLLSVFVTSMYALIAFSGIKTMSYYHGEEENVIEMGISSFFLEFASITEILSYFDETPLWGFVWFSSVFICLYVNLWILYLFLRCLITDNISFARRHLNLCNLIITVIMSVLCWPLFCSDFAGAISVSIEIIQLLSSLLLSISLYWVYGYNNHNIDIIFMIGIKANYFWKTAWAFNPILILTMLYTKFITLETQDLDDSTYMESFGTHQDMLIVYVSVSIYAIIVVFGILVEFIMYLRCDHIGHAFSPTQDWGPQDKILFKSRKMFVPEVMTREFLYRQVRIYGYKKTSNVLNQTNGQNEIAESVSEGTVWSALTSN